jgi:molybdenum cofactor guanylyltransferase
MRGAKSKVLFLRTVNRNLSRPGVALATRRNTFGTADKTFLRRGAQLLWVLHLCVETVSKVDSPISLSIRAYIINDMDSVTGFVLAGGKSSRMGQDKAFIQLGGRTLLAHALELAKATTGSAWIVGSMEKFAAFGQVAEDIYPGQGPLAGIHRALTSTHTELNLILAVDMPFLQPDFLNYLVAQARDSKAAVVVPATETGLQPLCAVYRREFAEVAERSLVADKNKIERLFAEVQTRVIKQDELERNRFSEEMFRNLNTELDWEEAKQKLSAASTRG